MAMPICIVVILLLSTAVTALVPSNRRRALLDGIISTSALIVAATPSTTQAALDASVLEGKYTDPINHPGGIRNIELTGTGLGGFQLAKVTGGGGKGEPASFELNAMVSPCPGRRPNAEVCITIDFAPKGGPSDFGGYYDEEAKGIRFPADGNFWPKVE